MWMCTVPFGELCGLHTRPTLGPPERRQRNSSATPPRYSSHSRWRRAPPSGTNPLGWASRRRSFRRTSCGCTSSGLSLVLFWDRPVRRKKDHSKSHVCYRVEYSLVVKSYHATISTPLFKVCVPKETLGDKNRDFQGQLIAWSVIDWNYGHLPAGITSFSHLWGDQPAITLYNNTERERGKG